jgi:galactokinase/mevalonate kinase-like predicted kinase
MPGLNYLHYTGGYWPDMIVSRNDEPILQWLEKHIYLLALGPRDEEYDVLGDTRIDAPGAERLSRHAEEFWNAVLRMDATAAGKHMTASFDAQCAMFPRMADGSIRDFIQRYATGAEGYKLSGAGGGGYLIMLSAKPVPNAIQVKIRRKNWL